MLKKYKIMVLLLSILLVIGFAGCGKSKASKGKEKEKTSEVAQNKPSDSSNGESANPSTTTVSFAEQEDIPIELRILPTEEFGRDNPFIPLVASGKSSPLTKSKIEFMNNYVDRSEQKFLPPPVSTVKKPQLPNVRLNLVIDGSTAVFEENGSSKVLSTGETVGGLKIQEIRRDGAVLININENKKFTAYPGGRIEEIPSSVQQKQAGNTSKPVKGKKK